MLNNYLKQNGVESLSELDSLGREDLRMDLEAQDMTNEIHELDAYEEGIKSVTEKGQTNQTKHAGIKFVAWCLGIWGFFWSLGKADRISNIRTILCSDRRVVKKLMAKAELQRDLLEENKENKQSILQTVCDLRNELIDLETCLNKLDWIEKKALKKNIEATRELMAKAEKTIETCKPFIDEKKKK